MVASLRQLLLVLTFLAGICAGLYLGAVIQNGHAQPAQSVPDLIDQAAARHGLSEWGRQRAHRIAWCESRYQARAYNRSSSATGVFQFIPSTARALGINPWDVWQNIDTAIRLMAAGQWQHWRACW